MNIEKVASKLAPLMPDDVKHWLRVRELADSDTRDLIDKEIRYHAYDRLGDFHNRLLLSLPPRATIRGSFNLGTIVYDKEQWPCGLRKHELLQNLAIFGRSGAGKTNVAFHILEQLIERKIPFLFLDWKRTARHLLPRIKKRVNIYTPGRSLAPMLFNPFMPPPGLQHRVYVNHLVDVIAEAYTLGDGARSILRKAIVACYQTTWPRAKDVLDEVERMELKGRAHGWRMSAVRALETLSFIDPPRQVAHTQRDLVESLLHQNTILELNGLDQGTKKLLVPILCLWLYYVRLGASEREILNLVIFIEEAHHVLYRQEQRAKESVMNMLLRQCREMGMGIVVIDQHPHLISSAALGNTYTTICLNHKDPADINKAAALSLVDEEDKKWFSMLPVGQGIVKLQDRWVKPFVVNFPLVQFKKGLVTDELLSRLLSGSTTLSALKRRMDKEFVEKRRFRIKDIVLEEDAFGFIEDIDEYENDGVDARYKRLGLSADKGNRLKQHLVGSGVIQEQMVTTGRTRKVLLKVAERAARKLGLDKKVMRGSLAHEYWKGFYAELFRDKGYQIEFESPRRHGRVDVRARKGNESVAIEVETGKSDVVWNVRQDLLAKFTRVLVVATDESALGKVTQQLARARLYIPNRVVICLRDDFKKAA